ncbi:MAG TPA: thioredoxin family protein [Luteolibacter sp.]|nr:thioredoxin family protein [Luteolibacter sp.]
MKMLLLALVPMLLLPVCARAEDKGEWVADYEVAAKIAAEQKRRIFVLFTNSKTCVPCRMLKDAVLTKPEFLDYAAKNLVLLQIDYAPYHDKAKTLNQIEDEKKVPKELWMKGRGPWPYLFVLSPTKDVLYSGVANDKSRATVADYLKFLDGLKK